MSFQVPPVVEFKENTCVDQGLSSISWSQLKKWERRERREKREKMEKVKKEGKNNVCDQTHSLVQVHTSLSLNLMVLLITPSCPLLGCT
jgi:hypothetical protein